MPNGPPNSESYSHPPSVVAIAGPQSIPDRHTDQHLQSVLLTCRPHGARRAARSGSSCRPVVARPRRHSASHQRVPAEDPTLRPVRGESHLIYVAVRFDFEHGSTCLAVCAFLFATPTGNRLPPHGRETSAHWSSAQFAVSVVWNLVHEQPRASRLRASSPKDTIPVAPPPITAQPKSATPNGDGRQKPYKRAYNTRHTELTHIVTTARYGNKQQLQLMISLICRQHARHRHRLEFCL